MEHSEMRHKVHNTDWHLKAASHHHMTHKVSVILTLIYLNNNTSDYTNLPNKWLSSEEISRGMCRPTPLADSLHQRAL